MAIFVVLATIAGVVIVALTTSSGDSFEDAGRSDIGEAGTSSGFAEGARRPNEIRDPALESMGLRGEIQDLPPALQGHWHGKQSKNIGYRPYCPPWEYLTKGPNEKGEYEYDPTAAGNATIGGPDGTGGVYSSKPGCFAPCYWGYPGRSGNARFGPSMSNGDVNLRYFDDNRDPITKQARIGVNYYRAASYPDVITPAQLRGLGENKAYNHTDLNAQQNNDGKPYLYHRSSSSPTPHGSHDYPGKHPIPDEILDYGVPYIFIPNFQSKNDDPADDPSKDVTDRNGTNKLTDNNGNWADENWEWRADPINRTCTVVNVTQNDRIVCSSEWENCASRP